MRSLSKLVSELYLRPYDPPPMAVSVARLTLESRRLVRPGGGIADVIPCSRIRPRSTTSIESSTPSIASRTDEWSLRLGCGKSLCRHPIRHLNHGVWEGPSLQSEQCDDGWGSVVVSKEGSIRSFLKRTGITGRRGSVNGPERCDVVRDGDRSGPRRRFAPRCGSVCSARAPARPKGLVPRSPPCQALGR